MTAYFITTSYDKNINSIDMFRSRITDEFGSYVSSSISVSFNIKAGCNIYGFICDNKYIKNKYRDIINTEFNAKSCNFPYIYFKSLTKEAYETMFSIVNSQLVYFASKIEKNNFLNFINQNEEKNYIETIFGSHISMTIKYGEYDSDNYCMAFECNINYITDDLRNIINTINYHDLPFCFDNRDDNDLFFRVISFTKEKYNLLFDKVSMLQYLLINQSKEFKMKRKYLKRKLLFTDEVKNLKKIKLT